jgi:autonomous glycyl radical cofactor GrcA
MTSKPTRQERADMSHDQLLRAVWLLDDIIEHMRWIPVSERLPEDKINPVTQDAYVYPVTVKIEGVADIRYFSFWDGHWHNQRSLEMDDMVTAWKERPDPYNPLWGQNYI